MYWREVLMKRRLGFEDRFKKADTLETIKKLENKMSFLIIGIMYIFATLCYVLLFQMINLPANIKIIGTLLFLISGGVCLWAYYIDLSTTRGAILLSLCAMIPFIYTRFISIDVVGSIVIISYWLILLLISYFRSEYIYMTSVFVVSSLMVFNVVESIVNLPTERLLITTIPAILVWIVLIIVSYLIVNANRSKVSTILSHYEVIFESNEKIKMVSDNLEDKNMALEEKNKEIMTLNQDLDQINQNLRDTNISLYQQQEELSFLAYYDKLTKVPNRQTFIDELQTKLEADKQSQFGLALVLVDIDNFKHINDALGENFGDKVIRDFSSRISISFNEDCYVGRIGGNLFGMIINLTMMPKSFTDHLNNLKTEIEQRLAFDDFEINYTTSMGVVYYPEYGRSAVQLFRFAENALQHAKDSGRNQIVVFNTIIDRQLNRKHEIVSQFKNAFSQEEFSLVFQPILDVVEDKIVGCEALIRWKSGVLGQVSPAEFIPIAEASGAIFDLGAWVFDHACQAFKQLPKDIPDNFYISVNVSSFELTQPSFIEKINVTLNRHDLSATNFVIEITESALIKMSDLIMQRIHSLNNLGFRLAIDDFGSGYFSFDYLLRMKLNTLKIDKTLTDNMLYMKSNSAVIVNNLIEVMNNIEGEVLCEGIEHEEQLNYLKSINCHLAQGYFIEKPLPFKDFAEFVKKYNQRHNYTYDMGESTLEDLAISAE